MTTIVISQPLLFPWPGHFELMSVADIYVHLVDVQFADKSFTNRIQLKQAGGPTWMTIPIRDRAARKLIRDIEGIDEPWRRKHRELVRHSLSKAPHLAEALTLFDKVYGAPRIVDLLVDSIESSAGYLGIFDVRKTVRSDEIDVSTSGSQRILDIVRGLGGTRYVTAHGAANYLDHEAFERANIAVEYIDYSITPYAQLHGAFTPYVSVLDLVANMGKSARLTISPELIPWRQFLSQRNPP